MPLVKVNQRSLFYDVVRRKELSSHVNETKWRESVINKESNFMAMAGDDCFGQISTLMLSAPFDVTSYAGEALTYPLFRTI